MQYYSSTRPTNSIWQDTRRHGKCSAEKERLIPKEYNDACLLLIGWHNNYGGWLIYKEANDGVAFTTVSDDKEEPKKVERRKKSHALGAKKLVTMQASVKTNCLPRQARKRQIC